MNKQNQNNKNTIGKSYKKEFLFSANFFFLLIFLGFCLTTNTDATILHKYSIGYVWRLFILLLLAIPYNVMILFIFNDRIFLQYNKKNYNVGIKSRITISVAVIILFLLLTELFLRMKPKPYVEDFHPFLQAINTKKNEGYLHVDSAGFRYDEISPNKPKGVYRVFVLGGSTVLDQFRPYDQTLVKQIEDKLRIHYPNKNIQVINAGYARYTSEHSLILYETKVQDYHPDLVVLFQGFNDLYYSCTPSFSPIRTYQNDYSHFYEVLTNITNSYFNYQLSFDVLDRIAKAFQDNFYSDIRNKLPSLSAKTTYTAMNNFPSLNAYTRNTKDIVKLVKADNVKMILGNQPVHYNGDPKNYGLVEYYCRNGNVLVSPKSITKGMQEFNNETKQIAQQYHIPFVDLASQIPPNDQYFTDDVHYTDLGDDKVAQLLYNAIVKSGYVNQ